MDILFGAHCNDAHHKNIQLIVLPMWSTSKTTDMILTTGCFSNSWVEIEHYHIDHRSFSNALLFFSLPPSGSRPFPHRFLH